EGEASLANKHVESDGANVARAILKFERNGDLRTGSGGNAELIRTRDGVAPGEDRAVIIGGGDGDNAVGAEQGRAQRIGVEHAGIAETQVEGNGLAGIDDAISGREALLSEGRARGDDLDS